MLNILNWSILHSLHRIKYGGFDGVLNTKKFKFLIIWVFSAEDDVCKEVSVNVDGEETRIIFVDHQHGDMSVSKIKVLVWFAFNE